jgi:hypothetical protein
VRSLDILRRVQGMKFRTLRCQEQIAALAIARVNAEFIFEA